jgi:hypothetical protein
VIEERDHAHIALRVAGDERRGRAKDLTRIFADRLCLTCLPAALLGVGGDQDRRCRNRERQNETG